MDSPEDWIQNRTVKQNMVLPRFKFTPPRRA